jgi:hypothetical protein
VLAAILLSVVRPATTFADPVDTTIYPVVSNGTATYYLTTSSAIPAADPNSTGPQVILDVQPPGGVIPSTNPDGTQASPLLVQPDSTGFNPQQLVVGLQNSPAGQPADQQLGLGFFGSGFQSGGLLHFSLNLAPGTTAPDLVPVIDPATDPLTASILPTAGSLHVAVPTTPAPETVTPTVTPTVVTTPANTPEPMSLVLWSALAGLGLLRARRRR